MPARAFARVRVLDILAYILAGVAAYFLGSIPTGFVVARVKGVDICNVGSRNIGATNVFRVLGKGPGILVLLADALKGYAACTWLAAFILRRFITPDTTGAEGEAVRVVAGICAILGHNYTCWLRFKGGKGVATTGGVLLGLAPLGFLCALGVWIIVFAVSRYVSLGSIAAAVSLPFAVWLNGRSVTLIVVFAIVGALAIFKHRSNIQRLLNGTENRLGAGKSSGSQAS